MISSAHPAAAQARDSSTAAPARSSSRLTPFERDTRDYGKAGATIIGGARALADAAGAKCSFSPRAVAQAATAAAAGAAAAPSAVRSTTPQGIVNELGDLVDAAGQAIEDFGGEVASASWKVVSEAAAAYGAVAEMVESAASVVSGVSNAVSDWSSEVVDEVSDIADAVVDGVTDVADDVAGYSLILLSL